MQKQSGSLFMWQGNPGAKIIPLALQHLLAMVVGCISPSVLIAAAAGLDQQQTILLLQSGLLVSGIATLIQIFPPFGKIGARLPLVFGVSYAFVPVLSSIAAQHGMAVLVGAQLLGSLFAVALGAVFGKIRRFFPSVVIGTVVITVGISLYPIVIANMAGGTTSTQFGSAQNWILSLATLAATLYFTYFRKGIFKYAALLFGILAGFLISIPMGMVDFSTLSGVQIFDAPEILAVLPFGIEFEFSSVLAVGVMFLVNGVQVVGEMAATTQSAMGRLPTVKELSGGVIGNGIAGFLGALLGSVPTSALGRNMGIVATTKVINRRVFALTAILLIAAGLMPIFGAVLSLIPKAVLGGATLSAFAAIVMTGVQILVKNGIKWRMMVISGISIALCTGILNTPESIARLPEWFYTLFGTSPVAISTICAVVLNLVLPKNITQPSKENNTA